MKKFTGFLIGLILIMAPFAYCQEGSGITMHQITDQIYEFNCPGQFVSNVVASVGHDGILLVDTAYKETAEQLKAELARFEKPLKYIVITHSHSDHYGGNDVLGQEALIIAHEQTRRNMITGYNLLQDLPDHAVPALTFTDRMSLYFNGEEIRLIPFGGGHCLDDVAVYFTKSNVVCLSGLLYSDKFPYIETRQGAKIQRLIEIYHQLLAQFPDDAVFVSGHGRDYSKADLKKYQTMLMETLAVVEKGLAAGKDAETLKIENVLAEWDNWGRFYVSKDYWLDTIVRSLSNEPIAAKPLVFDKLFEAAKEKDAAAAITLYHQLKTEHPDDYDFSENNLNALGYFLLGKNRVDEAIIVLKLNTEIFPDGFNTWDSLAEAYMAKGEQELAIQYYQKSLDLNPDNQNAVQMLEKLKSKK